MADNEGARMEAMFMVISLVPDVCKSPIAPVPYPIVGYLDQSTLVSPNVRTNGVPVFHMGSRVATVVGDEAGAGLGVVSQVTKGMCRPVIPALTVRVNGQLHTHHQMTLMLMNCAGPEGPCNTLGHLKYLGPMLNADVGPGGTIPVDPNPPIRAESFAEGGCMPKLDSVGSALGGGGLGDIVGLAQKAYGLATTDWSNPSAALGAIGGLAGMAGMGNLAQAAKLASGAAGLATADWSNPGSAIGAAMGVAGPMLGSLTGGASTSSDNGMGTVPGIAGSIPIAKTLPGASSSRLPPGINPCF